MKAQHTSLIAIACCTLFALSACKQKLQQNVTNAQSGQAERPEMVSSGIGAKFSVPPGQVAVFEIVTRRGGATVALPSLAAYVLAPPGEAEVGTLRFFPESAQAGPDVRRHAWKFEMIVSTGVCTTEDFRVPEALEPAIVRLLLNLELHSGDAAIHWNRSDDTQLPDDGLIGLRVTLFAHDKKMAAHGFRETDWKK